MYVLLVLGVSLTHLDHQNHFCKVVTLQRRHQILLVKIVFNQNALDVRPLATTAVSMAGGTTKPPQLAIAGEDASPPPSLHPHKLPTKHSSDEKLGGEEGFGGSGDRFCRAARERQDEASF